MTDESRSKYTQVYDGEWFEFGEGRSNRRMKIACCDCGLVHEHRIRIVNGEIRMQINRLSRETGGVRRALYEAKKKGSDDD